MTTEQNVVDRNELSDIRDRHRDETVVFCTGCYDVVHAGHAVFFQQCASFGDTLVVGVGRDSTLRTLKGDERPIEPENNRVYLVSSFRDVDYAVLNDEEIVGGKVDFATSIRELEPDVFVLNDDDSAIDEKRATCDEVGAQLELVERSTPEQVTPTSTTEIVERIRERA